MKFNVMLKKHINFRSMKRQGQILIPSLLVIPSLLIFVFLLFETAKLSREKIRQQFAIDSAVFIQMGDYTNIFNRTAYVNGAFPYRLFKEQYGCIDSANYKEATGKGDPDVCVWDMLYGSGAIPKNVNDNSPESEPIEVTNGPWTISYKDEGGRTDSDRPVESEGSGDIDMQWLITKHYGQYYWITFDYVTAIYQFYVFAYQVFGSIEAAQWTVFERITNNSLFLRQSYYFNANTPECVSNIRTCADQGVSYFNRIKVSNVFLRRIKKMGFHGKEVTSSGYSPYNVAATREPMVMNDGGLFQTAGFDTRTLKKIGNGIDVYQTWKAPQNYFNIDFNHIGACREVGKPCVHSKISSQCPSYAHTGENNCVWPNPTPKYQTRLYP